MKKSILFSSVLIIPIIISALFLKADGPGAWTQDLNNAAIYNACIVIHPTNPLIMYAGSFTSGVYLSIDGGITWIPSSSGLNSAVNSLAISNSNPNVLWAGTTSAGVFKSTDAGATWNAFNTGVTESAKNVQAIVIKPNDPNTVVICIFDGTNDGNPGVYKTTNGGTSWAGSVSGIGPMKNFLSMINNPTTPNTIYMGGSYSTPQTLGTHLYKSYDFGSSWFTSDNGFDTAATTGTDVIRCMSYSTLDTVTVLAGRFWNTTNGGPWLTTNAGASWVQRSNGFPIASAPGPLLRSIKIQPGSNSIFFAGGDPANVQPGGVWRSTDAGMNWSNFNSSPMDSTFAVRALNFVQTTGTLFAGVYSGNTGVYDYGFPIGIKNINGSVPKVFALHQNYPNPFNPTTTFTFDIPKSALVTVNVYDVSGRLVSTLVNEQIQPGSYKYSFDASRLSSGVYFYKITAGSFVDTKKMMLVK